MSSHGWRRVALPLLALAALQSATFAGAQSPANPPVRVPLPAPDPAPAPPSVANDSAPSWWTRHIVEPLQELGVESWRDAVRPGTWAGDIGLDFDAQDQRVRSPGSADLRYRTLLFRETLGIRHEGFALLHPKLATGNIGLRIGLQQDRQDTNGIKNSQNGTVLNYAFDTTLLPEHPYNAYLFATQSESDVRPDLRGHDRGEGAQPGRRAAIARGQHPAGPRDPPVLHRQPPSRAAVQPGTHRRRRPEFRHRRSPGPGLARLPERHRDLGPELPVPGDEAGQPRVLAGLVRQPVGQPSLQPRLRADAQLAVGLAGQLLHPVRG